jgi:pimeloyl-ACP methyl ester carboxylesterase
MRSTRLIVLIVLLAIAPAVVRAQAPPLWATAPAPPPMPVPDESGFVTRDGARLYYAVFHRRAGRPVVLLHGGLSSSDSWGFEVPRLAGHTVVVMDSRGQGRSSRPEAALTYSAMASDVVAVLDRLHLKRASVVGASDGGIIGLLLAIEHPDRVDKLFCWGGNFNTHAERLTPPDPALKAVGATYMARMEADYRRLSPTPDNFRSLRTALGRLYATEPNLTAADLGRIRARTVIADGEYEQFIDPSHTRLLAQQIPGARLVIIPGVSHGGPLQDPAAFHAAVAELLKEPRASRVH